MLICWTLFGSVAGYVSARLYMSLKGEDWKPNLIMTAAGFPTWVDQEGGARYTC